MAATRPSAEGDAPAAAGGFDAAAALNALRERGAQHADPVRFRFIEALARRTEGQPEAVRRLLQAKLARALDEYLARYPHGHAAEVSAAAPHAASEAPAPSAAPTAAAAPAAPAATAASAAPAALTASTAPSAAAAPAARPTRTANPTPAALAAAAAPAAPAASSASASPAASAAPGAAAAPAARAAPPAHTTPAAPASPASPGTGPLGQLAQTLAQARALPVPAQPHRGPAPTPELQALAYFRHTWAKLAVHRSLNQSIAKTPKNAGPLNSHRLVLRSLEVMREVSPDYLNRFVGYVDALLVLDGMGNAAPAAAPAPPPVPAAPGEKKRKPARGAGTAGRG